MNKQQSQMVKGVAILLMIFLHLFNQSGNVELCHNFIVIGGEPLVYILSRASNPVAFFLILSGYGLYKVYIKGDKHRWSRLLKLMIHYWIILIIFLSIGHFIKPSSYPGSFADIISNFTGYETTYNGEMWFLLPYIFLSASSPLLFRIMSNFRASTIVFSTLLIHLCTSFCISRYGSVFLYQNYWIYNPFLVLHLLFNFSLGAMAARSHLFERIANISPTTRNIKWLALAGVIILVLINCLFKYNYFYAFGVITCLLYMPIPKWIKTILCKFGNQSMNMWMIHSWFCYYLFHDFIYSFSYPLLIFIVLVSISYMCSLIINLLARPVEKLMITQREINTKPII